MKIIPAKNVLILFILTISFLNKGIGQDIHFSHIKAVPTILNPAMTGLFNGKMRYSANYKGQWNTFTKGYETMAVSADMRVKDLKSSIVGGGFSMFSDKAGDLGMMTNSISLNASFIQLIGKDTWASIGFQNSFSQNRLDMSEAVTFQQETSHFSNNRAYWDLATGVVLMHEFGKGNLVHIGAALAHLNRPNISFLKTPKGSTNTFVELLDEKITIHGGADLRLSNYLEFRSGFVFMDQGPHREISLGSFLKYTQGLRIRNTDKTGALYLGTWFRWYSEIDLNGADALIATARLDYDNTSIAISYDINVSSLSKASLGQGGVELSFVRTMEQKKKRVGNQKLKCPADYF
jgi:type IX secretion system PorP/SprF family membrane protein